MSNIKEAIVDLEEARNKKAGDFVRDGTLYDGWKRYCGYLQSVIDQALTKLRTEQPLDSEFTKECRSRHILPMNQSGDEKRLFEACTRLDRSEAGERILEERIEKLSDTLDCSEASREVLLTACEKALEFISRSNKTDWDNEITPVLEAAIAKEKEVKK